MVKERIEKICFKFAALNKYITNSANRKIRNRNVEKLGEKNVRELVNHQYHFQGIDLSACYITVWPHTSSFPVS